jgi:hypothetical protein
MPEQLVFDTSEGSSNLREGMFAVSRPPILQRLARGVVVVAICLSLGLQWAALQGIAWTSMLISYSRDNSIAEAVSKTFDGDHPCPLCHVVEEGRGKQAPETPAANSSGKKMDAVLAAVPVMVPPAGNPLAFPDLRPRAMMRVIPPPAKPPRAALA